MTEINYRLISFSISFYLLNDKNISFQLWHDKKAFIFYYEMFNVIVIFWKKAVIYYLF